MEYTKEKQLEILEKYFADEFGNIEINNLDFKDKSFTLIGNETRQYFSILDNKAEMDFYSCDNTAGVDFISRENSAGQVFISKNNKARRVLISRDNTPREGGSINESPLKTGIKSTSSDSAFCTQVGGGHYIKFAIQPIEFIMGNNLPYAEGNVIKYTCRHSLKGGKEDLEKAIHYLNMVLQRDYSED
jgi:hypothetical protein